MGLLEQLPKVTAMIPEMDVRAGLEAALLVEGVRVGVEELVALLSTQSNHLILLLNIVRSCLLFGGAGLKTRSLKVCSRNC